jgi:nucleotide-binding universal stress UspA family protein
MHQDIIVGWDGSEGARDALALARLLHAGDGAITAAYVHSTPGSEPCAGLPAPEQASAILAEARAMAETDRQEIATEAVESIAAADGLIALAGAREASLLVLGSSRHGPEGRVHTGGVGRRLIGAPPCALALPPRGFHKRAHRADCVAVVFDGAHQLRAVTEAAALARSVGAGLRVFCVVPELARWARDAGDHAGYAWENVSRQHHDHYRDLLEQAVADLDPVPATARLVEGPFTPAALADTTRGVDLLVTGPPATGALERLVAGVAGGTVHSAQCPVLVCARVTHGAGPGSIAGGAAHAPRAAVR